MTDRVNENGVYEPDETLALPRAKAGWRGGPVASIDLRNLGDYWIWATGFQMMDGDSWGSASPLMDDTKRGPGSRRSPTRDAAIASASDYLRGRLGSRNSSDARAVIAWLDTLRPDQFDLFGSMAA